MQVGRLALGLVVVGLVLASRTLALAQATDASVDTPPPASGESALADPTQPPTDPAATASATATTSATTTAAPVDDDEHCDAPPAFDPSSPRLDLSIGGGYAAYFVTWRQVADNFMGLGAHVDGGYFGPLARAEIELGLGAFSLSVNYTHIFSQHDGTAASVDWALLSGELGLQCACSGSTYVWGFGLEVGWDLNNNTLFAGIEHRSQFFVWEGLFLGFDFDVAVLVGLTSHGASGGGFEGSLFIGYSLG